MSRGDARLAQLGDVARLVLERQLDALRRARAEEEALRAALARLAASERKVEAPETARIVLAHAAWVARRRADLERALDQAAAEGERRLGAARLAFGRDRAIARLRERG